MAWREKWEIIGIGYTTHNGLIRGELDKQHTHTHTHIHYNK